MKIYKKILGVITPSKSLALLMLLIFGIYILGHFSASLTSPQSFMVTVGISCFWMIIDELQKTRLVLVTLAEGIYIQNAEKAIKEKLADLSKKEAEENKTTNMVH